MLDNICSNCGCSLDECYYIGYHCIDCNTLFWTNTGLDDISLSKTQSSIIFKHLFDKKINLNSSIYIAKLLRHGRIMYDMVHWYKLDPRIFTAPKNRKLWDTKIYEKKWPEKKKLKLEK